MKLSAGEGAYKEFDPITDWKHLPAEKVHPLTEEVAVEDDEYDYEGPNSKNVRVFENKFNGI